MSRTQNTTPITEWKRGDAVTAARLNAMQAAALRGGAVSGAELGAGGAAVGVARGPFGGNLVLLPDAWNGAGRVFVATVLAAWDGDTEIDFTLPEDAQKPRSPLLLRYDLRIVGRPQADDLVQFAPTLGRSGGAAAMYQGVAIDANLPGGTGGAPSLGDVSGLAGNGGMGGGFGAVVPAPPGSRALVWRWQDVNDEDATERFVQVQVLGERVVSRVLARIETGAVREGALLDPPAPSSGWWVYPWVEVEHGDDGAGLGTLVERPRGLEERGVLDRSGWARSLDELASDASSSLTPPLEPVRPGSIVELLPELDAAGGLRWVFADGDRPPVRFFARIVERVPVPGVDGAWRYGWRAVVPAVAGDAAFDTASQPASSDPRLEGIPDGDGTTLYALNRWEPFVLASELSLSAGCELTRAPLPPGTIVEMDRRMAFDGSGEVYSFAAPPAVATAEAGP